jgi:D-galactose 1-dehydrogenase
MAKTYTLGLVGVGKIAVDQHLPSIAETGLFDLVALVSQRGVTRPGVRTFSTQAEMLVAMPELDAVANCTPPEVRHGAVREALEAGKHVLIEKPPTATVSELEDLILAAKQTKRTLFATWHSQFNPAVDEAKARLAGAKVRRINVTWKEDVRRWHPGQDWIWQPGGFGVFDPAINAISILTKILPFSPFVTRADLEYPVNRETPIGATVTFRGPEGAGVEHFQGVFDWRQEGEQTWTIELETQDGQSLVLTRGGTCLTVDGQEIIDLPDQEYRHIYRRFHALIEAGASDVDAAPLRLVADSFFIGRRRETDPFNW